MIFFTYASTFYIWFENFSPGKLLSAFLTWLLCFHQGLPVDRRSSVSCGTPVAAAAAVAVHHRPRPPSPRPPPPPSRDSPPRAEHGDFGAEPRRPGLGEATPGGRDRVHPVVGDPRPGAWGTCVAPQTGEAIGDSSNAGEKTDDSLVQVEYRQVMDGNVSLSEIMYSG